MQRAYIQWFRQTSGVGTNPMSSIPEHLKNLEEIEREGISGLVEVFREEGIEAVRYALWTRPAGVGITPLPA